MYLFEALFQTIGEMSVFFLGHDLVPLLGVGHPLPSLPQSLDHGRPAPQQDFTCQPAAAQVGSSAESPSSLAAAMRAGGLGGSGSLLAAG